MLAIKIVIYSFIFLTCSVIGILISKKYSNRVQELKEFKSALNIFKTKIRYTYDPIPEIFLDIAKNLNSNISNVFSIAANKMDILAAGDAWNLAIKFEMLNINDEDRMVLRNLSKLLGKTDLEGQINQIDITENYLEEQKKKAETQREKSEKMYRTLGMIIGLTIVIVLV